MNIAPVSAQTHWELETGIARTLSNPDHTTFHYGVLTSKDSSGWWKRMSLDLRNRLYPQYRVLYPWAGNTVQQDSGMTQFAHLSLGLEKRGYRHEYLALYAGAEAGVGYAWTNRTIRQWEGGNLNEDPSIETIRLRQIGFSLSPYVGLTIWMDERIGFFAQMWWYNRMLVGNSGSTTSIDYLGQFEGRAGVTLTLR